MRLLESPSDVDPMTYAAVLLLIEPNHVCFQPELNTHIYRKGRHIKIYILTVRFIIFSLKYYVEQGEAHG